jgi:hypothetical protein
MMDDLEVARLAVASFSTSDPSLLPASSYLLPELRQLQSASDFLPFAECLSRLDPDGTVHDAASVLGRCERLPSPNTPERLIASLRLLCEIEARIRFSLWPDGRGAPHHFSKLLNTQKVQALFSRTEILAILAIFADPKGLNLRNVTAHGFSIDTSLTLPLLTGISEVVLPKLDGYAPPTFDFVRELQLLEFHRFRLGLADRLARSDGRFGRFDEFRRSAMRMAYSLFEESRFVESLFLLFPLFEHSLRRTAVALLNLPVDRLCASSEDHFLSIQESCEVLPNSLKSMVTDLLFAPDGPRLRDRLMHGNVTFVPREFALLLFVLFDKCTEFFEAGQTDFFWGLAFHPSRCLEFELSKALPVEHLDLLRVYNSEVYEKLTECLLVTQNAFDLKFKEPALIELLSGSFQKFICMIVLCLAAQGIQAAPVKHLLALAHAPGKFAPYNNADRFRKTVTERMRAIRSWLPFVSKGSDCAFEAVAELCMDDALLERTVAFVKERIDAS